MGRYLVTLSLVLAALWLVLSGVYKPLILGLGVASIALIVWLAARMEVVGVEHDPALFSWRLPVYWVWLVGQIVLANIDVARCILRPAALEPQRVEVPRPVWRAMAAVTYGNSITLTPGTVTLDLARDHLSIHALHAAAADQVARGDMAAWVRWLEYADADATGGAA